ncbi:MAG: PCMD domain-containing protein [Rikenellaceae bacterium]
MRKFLYITLSIICCATVSCIKNDIPYPYQFLGIVSISGDGFTTSIDELSRKATLTLDETTDIRNVEITSAVCSAEAKLSREIEGVFDLSTPLNVTLYNYQTYDWSIEAQQTISRSIEVVGQIGASVIDAENYKVYVTISDAIDSNNVSVTELKLGPEGITTMSPTKEELTSFVGSFRRVYVTYHGRTEEWFIYASFEEASVDFTICEARATRAWVETSGDTSTGEECGYRYRKFGDTTWSTLTVTPQSGYFSAEITGLTPETTYELQSYIGDISSPIVTRTTESTPQIANSDFEEWGTKSWVVPYLSTETYPVWDTGNQGSSLGGATLTASSTDTRPGSEGNYSACLTAQKVLVKFAAGNIFTGTFTDTYNTDGLIAFGFPFTQRPVALRGWYRYTCGAIDMMDTSRLPESISADITLGTTPDIGTIYVALGTWTPTSYTTPKDTYAANSKNPKYVFTLDQTTFFKPTDDDVVAYGSLQKSETVGEWTQFEIPIDYYDKQTLPTHIMIVASTSLYGDYFTGSTTSQMWLDDLELVYE